MASRIGRNARTNAGRWAEHSSLQSDLQQRHEANWSTRGTTGRAGLADQLDQDVSGRVHVAYQAIEIQARDIAFAAEIDAGHCPTLAREPEQAGGIERHRIGVVLIHVPDDVRFASGELAVGLNVEYDLLNGTSRPMVPSNNSEARQSEFLTDDNPWGYHTALWENFKGLDIHLTPCCKWSER